MSWSKLIAVVLVLFLGLCSPAFAGDKEDIVGRWDDDWLPKVVYWRFNDDGTFRRGHLFGSFEGKYKLLPGRILELETNDFFGRHVIEIEYKLHGDTFDMLGKYKRRR